MTKKLMPYLLKKGKNKLPVGASLLSVGVTKQNVLTVWAIVDLNATLIDTIAVFHDEDNIPPEPGKYIGTFQGIDKSYHVFQLSSSTNK